MEKNMQKNFKLLERRVFDSLKYTDLEYIRNELEELNGPTITSGIGGSSVVSEFAKKVIENKNNIITISREPGDFYYRTFSNFKNVLSCSYGGNNYGVELSFKHNLNKYLLSNNCYDDADITFLTYCTTVSNEKSFISLGTTLIPITILLNYYLDGKDEIVKEILQEYKFNFTETAECYEIFTGIETSTTAKYLESTLVESGIGIPIVHDKYSYCHGRSTISINFNNIAIYLYRNTEFDKYMMNELKWYYKKVIAIDSNYKDEILSDYQMLIKAMYLTKHIAEQKNKDLSGVDYSPIVKKIYKYKGEL